MPKNKENIVEPISAKLDDVATKLVANNEIKKKLTALYSAPLAIGDIELDCAILDDKENTRVVSMTSVFRAFDRVARSNNRLINIPAFIDAKNLQSYIDQELNELIKPIQYIDGKNNFTGYNALILPAICELYLKARREDVLVAKQKHLAEKAEILQTAFAKVGMIALVDEATGFQRDRKHNALRLLLAKYIEEGMQKWIQTFPDAFFVELDRLYDNEQTTSQKRPQYYGHFINRYIYKPIENGYVKDKLDKLNIKEDGKRKGKFHQWLTDNGRNVLIHQIGRVQGLMEMCPNIKGFKAAVEKQKRISIAPYLFDEMNRIIA